MNDWKDCTALEAHQAWVAKTHGVDTTYSFKGAWQPWHENDGIFRTSSRWRYRIREKMNTITVELPMPKKLSYLYIKNEPDRWFAAFDYGSRERRDAAVKAITAAMDKS